MHNCQSAVVAVAVAVRSNGAVAFDRMVLLPIDPSTVVAVRSIAVVADRSIGTADRDGEASP